MNSSSNATTEAITPAVRWAQRRDKLLITIDTVDGCPTPSIDIDTTSLHFKAAVAGRTYEVKMLFFNEIVPERSSHRVSGREVFFSLRKTEGDVKYWPRLLKDIKKAHFLKTDFNKWRDEDDESEPEEAEDFNLDDMMQSMGGLQGPGGAADFGGGEGEGEEDDSDDEDLPDLQQ